MAYRLPAQVRRLPASSQRRYRKLRTSRQQRSFIRARRRPDASLRPVPPTRPGYRPPDISANAPGFQGVGRPARPAPRPGAKPTPLVDDSLASAARAQALFKRNQGLGQIQSEGAQDEQDVQTSLARLREQRPKDEQSTRQSANRAGLFYSGQLGKQLGEIATDYGRRESDAQLDASRRKAAREAARQAILQGYPIEQAAISAENADRAIGRASDAADAGALVPNPSPGKPAGKPRGKPRPASPRKTSAHGRAGLHRVGRNLYTKNGQYFKRVGKGGKSRFVKTHRRR